MNGQPTAVKFYHPGREWSSRAAQGIAPWATNPPGHRRKYLEAGGSYLVEPGGPVQHGCVGFWGEYEAPTAFRRLPPPPAPHMPTFVHRPMPPHPSARPARGAMNADPLVLGEQWLYSNCQQGLANMRRLDPGDVVIFGSQLDGAFVVDTLFVVADRISYTRQTARASIGTRVADWVYPLVLELVADGPHVLYIGATYQNPINGLFSYVPCVDMQDCPQGFARPRAPAAYQSAQSQSVKYMADPVRVWHDITRCVLDAELFLGVSIGVPLGGRVIPSRCRTPMSGLRPQEHSISEGESLADPSTADGRARGAGIDRRMCAGPPCWQSSIRLL